ncbi:Mth938-like domain-containing protein [Aquabacterium sp.]|uniref:Mth938-like domain-containing protein n=1 Tax=Aquabacterium sp. TaxID=1872578 RepID=UPI002CDA16A6|nr:Mth938-like domain-containing protein [Aquabacterium sp.]HSW07700.1 Mth938-like domain-containing protein [Aquabacterium sp.]
MTSPARMLRRKNYNFIWCNAGALPPLFVKFQPDHLAGTNVLTRHAPGELWVGGTRFTESLLVPWVGEVLPWSPRTPQELTAGHFEALLALKPELVIFGSGARLQFVSPALLRSLIERRIGVETMDTAAACRTYNVLVAEGRKAVAALLLPQAPEMV